MYFRKANIFLIYFYLLCTEYIWSLTHKMIMLKFFHVLSIGMKWVQNFILPELFPGNDVSLKLTSHFPNFQHMQIPPWFCLYLDFNQTRAKMKDRLTYEHVWNRNEGAKLLLEIVTEKNYKIRQSFLFEHGGLRVNSQIVTPRAG